ncbi:MAG: hypothetical protein RLZZ32_2194 [Cyanobacteriota bacterium]|jgi:hypothetical protein
MARSSDADRLAASPTKWPSWPRGRACKVFMGYGWSSGTWDGLQGPVGRVWLGKEQRTVIVRDARNVKAG